MVLKGKATFEFETRTLNLEGAGHFLEDFFGFLTQLTLSNFKQECNNRFNFQDLCFINSGLFDFDFVANTHRESYTDCLEFSQHCHGFISVYVKKVFKLLIKKC